MLPCDIYTVYTAFYGLIIFFLLTNVLLFEHLQDFEEILRAPLTVYLYNITLKLFLKYGGFMQFLQNKGQF